MINHLWWMYMCRPWICEHLDVHLCGWVYVCVDGCVGLAGGLVYVEFSPFTSARVCTSTCTCVLCVYESHLLSLVSASDKGILIAVKSSRVAPGCWKSLPFRHLMSEACCLLLRVLLDLPQCSLMFHFSWMQWRRETRSRTAACRQKLPKLDSLLWVKAVTWQGWELFAQYWLEVVGNRRLWCNCMKSGDRGWFNNLKTHFTLFHNRWLKPIY